MRSSARLPFGPRQGSSGSFGASTMMQLCVELESAATSSDETAQRDVLQRLEAEFGRVRTALFAAFPATR